MIGEQYKSEFNLKRRSRSKQFAFAASLSFWDRPVASVVLGGFACALLLASALSPDVFTDARSKAINTISPVVAAVSYPVQEAVGYVRGVTGLSDIQARNAALEQENARLREWYQNAMVLQDRNAALEKLLNVKVEPGYKFVTARIIADAGSAFVKSLLVKVGTNDGVHKGNPVLSGDGLVGRVISTGSNASRILLLNDVNSRVPVMVEENDHHAVLAGQNDTRPVLDHLSKDAKVSEGMRVVTSGFGGMFPPGLPVGKIALNEMGQFEVILFSDLKTTQYVRVILAHQDPNLIKGDIE